ncbi:hypothetical protein [Limnohabitans sp.]
MSRYSQNKGIARIVRALVQEGWVYSMTSHPRVTAPTGEFITFALTPSDGNAHRQFERDVRRLKRILALKHKEHQA